MMWQSEVKRDIWHLGPNNYKEQVLSKKISIFTHSPLPPVPSTTTQENHHGQLDVTGFFIFKTMGEGGGKSVELGVKQLIFLLLSVEMVNEEFFKEKKERIATSAFTSK